MSLYSDLATDADSLLVELGQAVTVRYQTAGGYDPETGGAAVTTTDSIGPGVVFDYSASDIDGTMIKQGDKQLLLSVIGIEKPSTDDVVLIHGYSFRVIEVKEISPAGIPVLYDCTIRK